MTRDEEREGGGGRRWDDATRRFAPRNCLGAHEQTRPGLAARRYGQFARYAALLSVLWLVVYGGASWLASQHSWRVRLHSNAELAIPFVPTAAALYVSLFPLLWIAPLMLPKTEELRSMAVSLAWLIALSGVGFVALPGRAVHSRPDGSGMAYRLYAVADWINLDHNYFPSLHVGMAVVCAIAYARQTVCVRAWFFGSWAAGIAASTLWLHEHYLVDVLGGALLGWLVSARRRQGDRR